VPSRPPVTLFMASVQQAVLEGIVTKRSVTGLPWSPGLEEAGARDVDLRDSSRRAD
jgi:hypothetical protein